MYSIDSTGFLASRKRRSAARTSSPARARPLRLAIAHLEVAAPIGGLGREKGWALSSPLRTPIEPIILGLADAQIGEHEARRPIGAGAPALDLGAGARPRGVVVGID